MDPAARLLLRRLDLRRPMALERAVNPFEGARKGRAERVLRIGLHSLLAVGATPGQASLIASLRTPLAHRAIEVVPVAGRVPAWMRCGKRFRLIERGPDHHEALVRYRDANRRRVTQWTPISRHEVWRWIAKDMGFGQDIEVFLELEALATLGADVVITVDERLLAARENRHLRGLNLLTPDEAAVVIGVWTRAIHDAYITYAGVNNGLYYWAAARAVTPAAWPGVCGFVYGEHVLPDGQEVADLAGSILDHLKMMFRGLDRLLATWQCATNNDTDDEMLHEFVQMVMAAWSVHDNIALLAGRYLEIDLTPKHSPQWELGKAGWIASMTRKGATDDRASAIVDLVTQHLRYVEAIRDLRNDFAHRARNRMMRVSGPDRPDVGRLVVRGTMLRDVHSRLAGTPEGAEAWGFSPLEDYGTATSTDVDTGESHDVEMGPQSLLDLVPFAARLVAYVSWLANEAFRILDPLSDDRVPHRERCQPDRSDYWSNPEGAANVIATSGVAGLVAWALSSPPETAAVRDA